MSRRHRLLRLGLTGGVGSGKSTLAAQLATHGARVVDADQISRSLTAPGGAALPELVRAFGADMLDAQGTLRRERLRALVFQKEEARQRLQAILHPLIAEETTRQLRELERAGHTWVVQDIPLLVESAHLRAQMDAVLVVDCPEAVQVARVMARSGLARDQVLAIIAAQASRARRLACADWVVCNDARMTLAALAACAASIAASFSAHPFSGCAPPG